MPRTAKETKRFDALIDGLFDLDEENPFLSQMQEPDEDGEAADDKAVKYSPDEPRDDHGRWTGSGSGEGMVSPNISEGLGVPQAQDALSSARHQELEASFRTIDHIAGAAGSRTENAIGAWRDGAENSTITAYNSSVSPDAMRVSMAMKGLVANQKQVALFTNDAHGEQSLVKMTVSGKDAATLNKELVDGGIEYHTLVPTGKNNYDVHVISFDHATNAAVDAFAEKNGATYNVTRGNAEFIGHETDRAKARAEYESIITPWVRSHASEASAAEWGRIRDRWGDSKATEQVKFDPAEPRDDHGRWTNGGGSGSDSGSDSASSSESDKPILERSSAAFPKLNPAGTNTAELYRQPGTFAYTPERAALHKAIIDKLAEGVTPVDEPVAITTGGGPAAGKSTIINDANTGIVKVPKNAMKIDADAIKKMLPEFNEMKKAGDINAGTFSQIESTDIAWDAAGRAAAEKLNTVVDSTGDSTLAGLTEKLAHMREGGHKVVAHYVTCDVETALSRNHERAKETGTDPGRRVPDAVIKGVHREVSITLPQAVHAKLFDEVTLWDTNSKTPVKIMSATKDTPMVVHDQEKWQKFLDKAKAPPTR